jgi:hypothetical protein
MPSKSRIPEDQRSPALRAYYRDHDVNREANRIRTQLWRSRHPGRCAELSRLFRQKNPGKQFEYDIRCRYNLSLEKYQEFLQKQDYRCALCREEFKRWPCIDHDHGTNEIRGLLCITCNHAIAKIERDPQWLERVKEYLE